MRDLLERSLGPRSPCGSTSPRRTAAGLVDANQLELAILNLVINARDAMPDGGTIDISVDEADAKTRPDLTPGNYLRCRSPTPAPAWTPETLKKAIEPFFSTKALGKGTGLGLSMVHGLAVQLGGALQLSSKVGKGTTATLWLPVAAAAPEAEIPALPAQSSAARR